MGAGWVINVAVAEWIIRKRPAPNTARDQTGAEPAFDRSGWGNAADLSQTRGQ